MLAFWFVFATIYFTVQFSLYSEIPSDPSLTIVVSVFSCAYFIIRGIEKVNNNLKKLREDKDGFIK